MTGRLKSGALTLAALMAAALAAWHGPAIAARLGLGELSLVAGLIAAVGVLTAVEWLYDRLGREPDQTRPDTGNSAPVTPDAASDNR